ncbi:hypothetical protein [Xanthomonas campestris]|uniref:hypothetical protein n=1 Tax=Xanthomonas campestris TaxID=339 RepID=UPI001D1399BA|nr:hypothetical protein [Xanthomonas campestris]MCC3256359.1 hypothetical protein [Xanthomonas campestris pv. armoraciae]
MPTQADVQRIKDAMKSLPEVTAEERNLNNQEAVTQMMEEITGLRTKGYTWEKIAEVISDHGIAIKASTLKSYARRAETATTKPKRRSVKKPTQVSQAEPGATKGQTPEKRSDTKKATAAVKQSSTADARFTAREDSNDI